jgi:hypothetical protein
MRVLKESLFCVLHALGDSSKSSVMGPVVFWVSHDCSPYKSSLCQEILYHFQCLTVGELASLFIGF